MTTREFFRKMRNDILERDVERDHLRTLADIDPPVAEEALRSGVPISVYFRPPAPRLRIDVASLPKWNLRPMPERQRACQPFGGAAPAAPDSNPDESYY